MRVDGAPTWVWEDIDLTSNRSHLVGATDIITTTNFPNNSFSEKVGNRERNGEHTWLDDNREVGE